MFCEGVAEKNDDRYVTRNNQSKILVLALQVFDVGSETCNTKIAQKIVSAPMLSGINFQRNIVALRIVVANRPRITSPSDLVDLG